MIGFHKLLERLMEMLAESSKVKISSIHRFRIEQIISKYGNDQKEYPEEPLKELRDIYDTYCVSAYTWRAYN